jgi:hypothetical protein
MLVRSDHVRAWTVGVPVGTHPATIFVDQPIDPFFTRPAYTTFLRVCIRARPVALLVSLLLNRLQGKKYVLRLRGWVAGETDLFASLPTWLLQS